MRRKVNQHFRVRICPGLFGGSGLFWGGCGSLVDEGCATTVGVAGVSVRAGVALLLGLLRGGLAVQAFAMPGYLL